MRARGKLDDAAIDSLILELQTRGAKPRSREAGAIMKKWAKITGVDESTIYRNLNARKKMRGHTVSRRNDFRRPRYLSLERKNYIINKVMAIKMLMADKKGLYSGTELACEKAIEWGYVPAEEMPSFKTLDRWFLEDGLSLRTREKAAVNQIAPYPNHTVYVDATVNNQFYLREKDGKIIKDVEEIYRDKNHFEDILKERKWQRIWDFYAVEAYSHSFYIKSYLTSGESASNWIDFLQSYFLKKDGIPVYGLPENIISDQSTGLLSAMAERFFNLLEINHTTHKPKNSRAKGKVESRIGAVKRGFSRLTKIVPAKNIDEMNMFNLAWTKRINLQKGYYQKWLEITPDKLSTATEESLYNATHKALTCTVDSFGQISINKRKFSVNENLCGQKVDVYIYREKILAVDNNDIAYEAKEPVTVELGNYHAWEKTESERRFERIEEEAKEIKQRAKEQGIISIMPGGNTNISTLPRYGHSIEPIKQPGIPEIFETLKDAWDYFTRKTGLIYADLIKDDALFINQCMENFITISKSIPRSWIDDLIGQIELSKIKTING